MIVFAGPSIAGVALDAYPALEIRAPVRQGDVYLATLERPRAIGIIDGYFEGVPSVWHKEILCALGAGIPVLGAASMGALRAAELHAFGMTGVGEIFAAYESGEIPDDDEVALVHGPEELGYPALSLAMVNVRATLRAGLASGGIGPGDAAKIEAAAKAQFYKTRTWDSVLAATDASAPVRAWVASHAVDQKRLDAVALLDRMAAGDIAPPEVDFHFVETNLWHRTTARWRAADQARRMPEPSAAGEYRLFGSET